MQNQTEYDDEKLASTFIKYGLVDEFRLYIHPIVLGGGKPMFPVEEKWSLWKAKLFPMV